ncbi:MAG: phospholipid carrier-dependent glycosyltransferase [Chloroflexaceae bacterium]|nr:phospholipid carrier-dependent glycosyltransferase [Chloroflexaceae bacterium]
MPNRPLPIWLVAVALGLLAAAPRCLSLADFFTLDEGFHWVWRVQHFAAAIDQYRWAETNLTGHPGVTTLWLGTLGRFFARTTGLEGSGWHEGSSTYLAWLRLPLALVNSLGVALGYLLLRRLLRPETALLAALLWATSPFLIAHSRLLHLDALLTTTMTLSILLLLLPQRWCLVASAVCAGLALLTKGPSLLLLPLAGVLLLFTSTVSPWPRRAFSVLLRYSVWLLIAALVIWLVWPAMWVTPLDAIERVLNEISSNGGQPHHTGNYFLGQPVADPGWLFYPAVVLWRTTPLVLVGLLLLPLALRQPHTERRPLLLLLLVALLFTLALSLLPKKFDRYLLPIWPILTILAAAGLLAPLRLLQQQRPLHRLTCPLLAALVSLLLLLNVAYHPYYLAYFNPLLGGGETAQQVLLVGWGEGLERVGAWLRSRPDLTHSQVISWGPRSLEPFVPVPVTYLNEYSILAPASYAVIYSRGAQRQESASAQAAMRQGIPLYQLTMYGIDYATVYQPPRSFQQPVDAVFGAGLHLRGFSQSLVSHTLTITPSWNIQTNQPGGQFSFIHVLDRNGQRIAQVDAPIDEGLFPAWQPANNLAARCPLRSLPTLLVSPIAS